MTFKHRGHPVVNRCPAQVGRGSNAASPGGSRLKPRWGDHGFRLGAPISCRFSFWRCTVHSFFLGYGWLEEKWPTHFDICLVFLLRSGKGTSPIWRGWNLGRMRMRRISSAMFAYCRVFYSCYSLQSPKTVTLVGGLSWTKVAGLKYGFTRRFRIL